MPSPMVTEISAELAEVEDLGESHIAVVWDFKSAHRIVQVHPDDWGLQACTLADLRGCTPSEDAEICLNTVGTFWLPNCGPLVGPPCRYGGKGGPLFPGRRVQSLDPPIRG